MAKSKLDAAEDAVRAALDGMVDKDLRNKQDTTEDQERRDEVSALRTALEHISRAREAREAGNEIRANSKDSLSHDEKQRARGVTDPGQAGNPGGREL